MGVVLGVLWALLTEWWIVFLYLFSLEAALGFWILYLVGVPGEISLSFMLGFAIVAMSIPFREKFLIGEDSVLSRFYEKYLKI